MATAAPLETDLREAAEERYLSYALSVITSRALPDVRDGLKPVQRRILYAMWQNLRLTAGARPRKSAAIVGEVLGKYHPHGDQAAYEAMVRMAQEFSLRYPLVHGEGNFGSLDGDGAAAYRYTEARLTAVAEELLEDLGADTVPFRATFDAMLDEPIVLPSAIPQLLMNGSTGIAVGMATNIPPHNLREVVAALIAMIDDPDIAVKDLLKHVKGPDFPTGGEVLNSKRELREIYETGQGPVRLRGEYEVENLSRGRRQVVVTSIPYTVNKAELVEAIANEIIARKLPLVTDVRDESTTDVRIVLELKSEASAEAAMAYLYKHTSLQTNFNVNLTCLLPTSNPAVGQPARVTLRDLCRHFLDHRMIVITRRLEHERKKLLDRLHILDALAKIYDDLDRAIRIIRKADSRQDAAQGLMKGFDLDQVQADAILEIRLYQLARLEISKILDERDAKRKRLKEVEALLKSPKARWKIIREDLERIAEKFGDKRRTKIGNAEELEYNAEAYIVHEETTVLLSRDGWLRRVRELKDPSSARLREGDALRPSCPGRRATTWSSTRATARSTCCASPTCRPRPATASPCSRCSSSATASASSRRSSNAKTPRRPSRRRGQGSLFAPAKGAAPADDPRRDGARLRLPRRAGSDGDDARRAARGPCGRRRRGRFDRAVRGKASSSRRPREDAALPDRPRSPSCRARAAGSRS